MSKMIDLNRSVFELVTEYPEIGDIMEKLGFREIRKPAMLHSVGKLMTLPRGARMKNIPMEKVIAALTEHGFTFSEEKPAPQPPRPEKPETQPAPQPPHPEKPETQPAPQPSRMEDLKGYLRRLGAGESLESVRKDFAEKFRDVEASEIMQAEQELMREGTPLTEVQKLCDIHSALFHGATREEQITNAEKEVMASVKRAKELAARKDYGGKKERAAELAAVDGHPLNTLTRENEALAGRIAEAKARLDAGQEMPAYFKDHPILYAGPAKTPEGYPCGSMGPTTANRMDPYVDEFQDHGASLVMIAKGNRTKVVTDACLKHGGFYLGTIGGVAAVLSQSSIRSIECVEYPELGMEAIWKIRVEDFPAFILVDDKGNDFFTKLGL